MALWSAVFNNWTPVAVADTTNMTAQGFVAIQGGSSTQRIEVRQVVLTGAAAAAAAQQLVLAHDSTVMAGATSNAAKLSAVDASTAALGAPPLVQSVGSGTLPQRSSTLHLLNCSFNAFGGQFQWYANKGEGLGILGNAASVGELSLSHLSSGTAGLMNSTIIFEPF